MKQGYCFKKKKKEKKKKKTNKQCGEKEKMLAISILSFFNNASYP